MRSKCLTSVNALQCVNYTNYSDVLANGRRPLSPHRPLSNDYPRYLVTQCRWCRNPLQPLDGPLYIPILELLLFPWCSSSRGCYFFELHTFHLDFCSWKLNNRHRHGFIVSCVTPPTAPRCFCPFFSSSPAWTPSRIPSRTRIRSSEKLFYLTKKKSCPCPVSHEREAHPDPLALCRSSAPHDLMISPRLRWNAPVQLHTHTVTRGREDATPKTCRKTPTPAKTQRQKLMFFLVTGVWVDLSQEWWIEWIANGPTCICWQEFDQTNVSHNLMYSQCFHLFDLVKGFCFFLLTD